LDLTNELVALAFDNLPIIVGQSAPLLLGLSDELLPVPFHLVSVHGPKSLIVNPYLANIVSKFPLAQLTLVRRR